MLEGLPTGIVTYDLPVRCVHWSTAERNENPVMVECDNGEMIPADHVIVTIPLGKVEVTTDMCRALFSYVLVFLGGFNFVNMTQNAKVE